jgi:hypothetical protein
MFIVYIMVDISGELIIALSSIFCTGIGSVLLYAFRIKCSEMTLCCWKCSRDVVGENHGYELEHHLGEEIDRIPPPSSRRSSINTT